MRVIFILLVLQPLLLFSQNQLHSPDNIRLFADYLFCEKDYLRAVGEYERLSVKNDTIDFKCALSYAYIYDYEKAVSKFSKIDSLSNYYLNANEEIYKINFKSSVTGTEVNYIVPVETEPIKKLRSVSMLLNSPILPKENEIAAPFIETDKQEVLNLYRERRDFNYKSELTAGVLSALIPGLGKMYTENYSDGAVSFIVTTLLGYLAYANLNAGHDFRGYLFSGLTAFFYGGNIYGSAASAQIYNANINDKFEKHVNDYLEEKNYFLGRYDFCK